MKVPGSENKVGGPGSDVEIVCCINVGCS